MKDLMEKKIKKNNSYKVNDIINLKISRADKAKLEYIYLPCKVLKVKSKGF